MYCQKSAILNKFTSVNKNINLQYYRLKNTEKNIIVLQDVDSTNNYANRLIQTNTAEDGTVVLAHYQKKGRGLSENYWESEPNKNLLASIILFPEFLPAAKQFYISKITSMGLLYCLKDLVSNVTIKWPNDIYIENKKIAGILIENAVMSNYLTSSILGIGLNVNQQKFVSDAPNPVSLKQISNEDYNIMQLVYSLIVQVDYWYNKLINQSLKEIDEQYFNNLYKKNEWTLFKQRDVEFEAKITGIGEYGQLIVTDKNHRKQSFMFKEIEYVFKT